jgi:peptide/nickel transport system permease protein
MLIAWVLGLSIGAIAGWLRRRKISSVLVVVATLVMVTPVYLIAIVLILLVAYHLRWLPPGQPYAAHLEPAWNWEFISSVLTHAILPMSSMILVWGASYTMGMRSLMISVLGEDYLALAKAKGLAPRTILSQYAFRNAFLPMVVALGIGLGASLNGALVVETLFMLPGLGGLFGLAMTLRDFNVMQGIVLISSIMVLTLGLIVDLALPFFDPRIRRSDA